MILNDKPKLMIDTIPGIFFFLVLSLIENKLLSFFPSFYLSLRKPLLYNLLVTNILGMIQ